MVCDPWYLHWHSSHLTYNIPQGRVNYDPSSLNHIKFCELQGFFLLYTDWTVLMSILCVTVNLLLTVYTDKKTKKLELWVVAKLFLSQPWIIVCSVYYESCLSGIRHDIAVSSFSLFSFLVTGSSLLLSSSFLFLSVPFLSIINHLDLLEPGGKCNGYGGGGFNNNGCVYDVSASSFIFTPSVLFWREHSFERTVFQT